MTDRLDLDLRHPHVPKHMGICNWNLTHEHIYLYNTYKRIKFEDRGTLLSMMTSPLLWKPIEQHKGGWETTFLMKTIPSTELCSLGIDFSLRLWKKICPSPLDPSRWEDSAHGSSTEARMHQSFLQWWEGSEALVFGLGDPRPTQLLGRHNADWIYNELKYSSFIFYLWKCCCLWNHSITA